MHGLDIHPTGALDFVSLGALVHRLDPGVVPFRKATWCQIHVSGGTILATAAVVCVQFQLAATHAKPPSSTSSKAEVVALWPEGVPGLLPNPGPEVDDDARASNVHTPTLTAYLAPGSTRNGTAMIVCPGGG